MGIPLVIAKIEKAMTLVSVQRHLLIIAVIGGILTQTKQT
jgi:hypothetical protein